MPWRLFTRDQAWLLPPALDELLADDHPARFVAAFVDNLDRDVWAELGIGLDGEEVGAPAYHPRALLSVWLYGFTTGVRSSRKLEGACRDQVPCLWLTGWQQPDHNTLWRFYQSHRQAMRALLKQTIGTAVELGLVDLAVQAVDGTKVQGNAAGNRTYDSNGLRKLLERTEAAISELEAQNEGGYDPPAPHLPESLRRAEDRRTQVRAAMDRLASREGVQRVNLTDGDAELMKGRHGIMPSYNAQAVVSPLDPVRAGRTGLFITAAGVTTAADDYDQLIPMLEQAEEMTGKRAGVTLADGGYHSGPNLQSCAERGQTIVMPEGQREAMKGPYFKDRFEHDAATNSYTCPQGQRLLFRGLRWHKGTGYMRAYRATGAACRVCPAFGICTKDGRWGRTIWIGPYDRFLRGHREWMTTAEARTFRKRRKELSEPVFGIMKEQMGARRFLLRGLVNVGAEFALLATAFNLRSLWRVRATRPPRHSPHKPLPGPSLARHSRRRPQLLTSPPTLTRAAQYQLAHVKVFLHF
jgi:transposase